MQREEDIVVAAADWREGGEAGDKEGALELALARAHGEDEEPSLSYVQAVLDIEQRATGTRWSTAEAAAAALTDLARVLLARRGSGPARVSIAVGEFVMPATHAAAFLGLPSALRLLHERLGKQLWCGRTPLLTVLKSPLLLSARLVTAEAAIAAWPESVKIGSPLLEAVTSDDENYGTAIVQMLVRHGAELDKHDSGGATPLMRLAGSSHTNAPTRIRRLGAAITDTEASFEGGGFAQGLTAVGIAVAAGHANCRAVLVALKDIGASLDALQGMLRLPPLWLAVDRKLEAAALALIDLGAKTVAVVGPGGESLASLAARRLLPDVESRLRSSDSCDGGGGGARQ